MVHCRRRARSASPTLERSAPAAKRPKLHLSAKAIVLEEDEEESDATDDDVPLAKLAGGRPEGSPEVGPPAGRGSQARGSPQRKPVERGPSQDLGRGAAGKRGGGSGGKSLSNGGRAPGSLKGKAPQKLGPPVAGKERKLALPPLEPGKDRKPGPPGGTAAKATGGHYSLNFTPALLYLLKGLIFIPRGGHLCLAAV